MTSLKEISTHKYEGDGFAAVCWLKSSSTIVAAGFGDGGILIYDYEKKEVKSTLKDHLFAINDISWSPHFSYLASAGDDTLTMIHDVAQ